MLFVLQLAKNKLTNSPTHQLTNSPTKFMHLFLCFSHFQDWIYNTTGGPVPGKINVHLVPHTHDDTGWQITVDQYFYQDVYFVIDTVVSQLQKDPNRKFMYVETAFFARWFDQQPTSKQSIVKTLVKNKQLEFINGGWCMHDEAAPLYTEMVDQTTRGHQFLKKHFGADAIPKGTWQIDPFGHSNTQAWLLGAEAGMESMFWGRTDFQDFDVRKNTSRLEWIWEGSQSLGSSAQIFAGELYGGGGGGYGTWIGFDGANNQVQDDPSRHDYNVDKMVDQFVQNAQKQAAHTATEHQMWACGSDFQYQNADHWYRNLDKLVHYINQNGTVNAFYSTPTEYVKQKKLAQAEWEVRKDDIFPLADAAHHYWSGYFTSRPALKRQVRFATNFLSSARQLEVIAQVDAQDVNLPTTRPSPPVGTSWTDSLEGTIGVATHHDGMSGTERQDVADDYSLRISESSAEVEAGVAMSLAKLMALDETDGSTLGHCNCNSMLATNCLNVSVCEHTTSGEVFSAVLYNPQGQASTQIFRFPVVGDAWLVEDVATGKAVPSQAIAISERTLSLPLLYLNKFAMNDDAVKQWNTEHTNPATHILSVQVTIPAMGYSTVVATHQSSLTKESEALELSTTQRVLTDDAMTTTTVTNGRYELTFDKSTGLLTTVTNVVSNISTPLSIEWGFYNSSTGGCTAGIEPETWACDGQKSGAYIFRPNSSTFFYPGKKQIPTIDVVTSGDGLVTEVRQTFSDWATHVVRLFSGDDELESYIEVEWTVGPIPFEDGMGKEVSIRYSSGLKTNGEFYTDSNGREMVKRVRFFSFFFLFFFFFFSSFFVFLL
jgi:alpha-mannosidase